MIYKLGEARIIICKYNHIMRPHVLQGFNITPPKLAGFFFPVDKAPLATRPPQVAPFSMQILMAYFGHLISKRGT